MDYKDFTLENYKLIFNSCLFDKNWYINTYFKDLDDDNLNPISHFIIEGVYKNYNPNSIFDTGYYLTVNSDVKNAGMNPLIHYILYGKNEHRIFSPTFELKNLSLEEELFYSSITPEFKESINKIIELNLMDFNYYITEYEEVQKANVNPLIHYLKIGANEGKNPSKIFDTNFYLKCYPDIKNILNPLIHYVNNKDTIPLVINEREKFFSCPADEKFRLMYDKINELENRLKITSNKYDQILDSYNEYLNFIFLNKNVKAYGSLRYTQLQTFEMLKFITKICENNNLTYWLDYGTLLGAIRHDGFVPWDDEADIAMPREDYEKFLKILFNELEKHDGLKERVSLQIPWDVLRGVKPLGVFPSPGLQFVDRIPLANVDIHVLDYYDVNLCNNDDLFNKELIYRKTRENFGINVMNKNYLDIHEEYVTSAQKVGITFEKTSFMGYALDLDYRKPTHVDDIFPLKKHTFEGLEFYTPNNPIKYLSLAYYSGDLMKIPKVIHHHDRVNTVTKQFNDKNIPNEFEKVLSYWRYVNSSIVK